MRKSLLGININHLLTNRRIANSEVIFDAKYACHMADQRSNQLPVVERRDDARELHYAVLCGEADQMPAGALVDREGDAKPQQQIGIGPS